MKKLLKHTSFSFVIATLILSSCIPLRNYVYLQGNVVNQEIPIVEPEAYRIQPNDNLYIQVISNDNLSMYFNLSTTDRYLNNDAAIELGSYKVDSNGQIDFPYLGPTKVSGLTTYEIKELLSKGISELLVQYSVVVKQVNRSVSLLGEFNAPGTYSFYKDRITIMEAIGLGRDLSDFANRKKIKIIRHIGGSKKIAIIDLTKTDIFKSEFYYILPNDIIYVEPTSRVYGSKTIPFTAILTTINTAVLLYNAINNSNTK